MEFVEHCLYGRQSRHIWWELTMNTKSWSVVVECSNNVLIAEIIDYRLSFQYMHIAFRLHKRSITRMAPCINEQWQWKYMQMKSRLLSRSAMRDVAIGDVSVRPSVRSSVTRWYWFTRSSAVAERPRDASCLSVVIFNIPTAQFLLVLTAASDLLVHKILLNSVLLSPIVSGNVRPKHPGQTPPRS